MTVRDGGSAAPAQPRPLSSIPKEQPDRWAGRERPNSTSAAQASLFPSHAEPDNGAQRRASRAKRLQPTHTPREQWLGEVEACTALHRERKAQRFTERAKAIGRERRTAWRQSGQVARNETGNVRTESFDSQWHLSRAKGARELFGRVRSCADEDSYRVKLTCRGCAHASSIPVGCDSHWFCPTCRTRRAREYRLELQAKLGGLQSLASRAGLTARSRRHQPGGRFGARFLTLTLPHVGQPRERIQTLMKVWPRFWRLLSDRLRPKLKKHAARGVVIPEGKEGELVGATLWDLVHYLWVIEWTPGSDGDGHPHLHVWLFSPFIDQAELEQLWRRAYCDVTGRTVERLVVDVRKASDDSNEAALELCKYLIKDWEVDAGGSKQARPEVFAQAYAELDGRRLRQTSAGFADFKLKIEKACPCCGHTAERGHWARVEIDHARAEELRAARVPGMTGPPRPPPSHETEADVSTYEWMMRSAAERAHGAWLRSEAGRKLTEFMRRTVATPRSEDGGE